MLLLGRQLQNPPFQQQVYEYISKVSLGENTGEILIKESLKLIDQTQAKR